jgi:hypothetical protein
VKAYINEDKLEIRRTKFLREAKQKVARFYKDLEAYLQDAYYKFEKDSYIG